MALYFYSKRHLLADYLRSLAGLAFAAIGLHALRDSGPIAQAAMTAIGGVFAAYGLRAVVQGLTSIEVDEQGIARRGPLPVRLRWHEIRRMTLRHYSVKRDKSAGWLELNISDGRMAPWRSVRLDSGLIGFQALAAQAAAVAVNNGVRFDQPSTDNLSALGISVASPMQSPAGERPLPRRSIQ